MTLTSAPVLAHGQYNDAAVADGSPDGGVSADAVVAPADAVAGEGAVTTDAAAERVEAPPAVPVKELEPGADRQTGIRGRVLDSKTGAPMRAVPVLARGGDGKTRTTVTDDKGAFLFVVPPGTYTLRAYFTLYHGVRMEGVRASRGAFNSARLVLDPIDITQDVVVVEIEIPYRADTTTVAAQDQMRKESRGIGEGMGSQQMSQQGAGDAGAAARRVVGVNVESNQLVIRGLGGRYVRVLLNNLPIPNTDPDFPSVDLDLFPTSVIDNLNVQKVFLPEIPGDFAGGVLDITTVSFPRRFVLTAGLSTAYNTQTTFKKRLSYRGGSLDWLGFDDGKRSLPGVVDGRRLVPPTRAGGPFPDRPSFEAAGEQFRNVWNFGRTSGLPQLGFNLTVGDSILLTKRRRFGYLASLVYDYAAERVVGFSQPRPLVTSTGDLQALNRYDLESGNVSVQLSAIGTASLDLGSDHSFTVLTLFNRSMDDQTRFRTGINAEVDTLLPYDNWQLRFLSRTIVVNQLLADHRNLGGTRLRLRWSGFYSTGQRDEPDQRLVKYGYGGGITRRWLPTAERLWSELSQVDVGGTTQLRFPLWAEAWGNLGGRAVFSEREFGNRRFQMQEAAAANDASAFTADPETLFSPDGMGPLTQMVEFTRLNDSYSAEQRNLAGFLSLETPIVGRLSASGGARLEAFRQHVQSKSPFPDDNSPEMLAMNRVERSELDLLPGAALKYALSDQMIVRAAYGVTLSRPQVRELAPYDYYDFLRDRIIVGNPNLKTTRIQNVDLRWEWFFAAGQVAAVSGFYKRFTNPIELQIIETEKYGSQYLNAQGATNVGVELELRSELAILGPALRRFSVGGNISLIRSQIQLEDVGATRTARRLAGQAPYVANVSLRYAIPERKLSAGLIYNVVGPRITDVGTRVNDFILPDIEELPFHAVDFVSNWGLSKHVSLKLRARNVLLRRRILKQGQVVSQELNPGMTISVGLGYDY